MNRRNHGHPELAHKKQSIAQALIVVDHIERDALYQPAYQHKGAETEGADFRKQPIRVLRNSYAFSGLKISNGADLLTIDVPFSHNTRYCECNA